MTSPAGEATSPLRRGLTVASRRLVRFLAFALIVHVFVLPQLGGAREALSVVSSINPWLIGLAVVLYASSLVAYAILTQHLLPKQDRPSLPIIMGAVLASTGVNHVVPGGAATTAAVNYRLLGRAGVKTDVLQFALGTQAIGSAVVLNVILWIALVISIPTSGFHPIYATAAAVGACLIGLFGLAVLWIRNGHEEFADRISKWASRFPG
ncbi:MAG: lysylphosphatidylglycerol synthase domain-containing protein [Acidimicrobiales bacterium]